ncbi:MAG: replicative DNA helicase [Hyphomonadaceae bacterium]|nr:replicative DNA helicase [Hyphomonadaceae bacterium]
MSADGSASPLAIAPPHDLRAEQALLGAILFDNDAFNRIGDKLKPHHFYDPVHGRIFAACADMIGKGKLADGVTLRERFQRESGLQEIGGASYLLTLHENAARMTSHARDYAEIIYELAVRRELIRVGNEITHLAIEPPKELDAQGQIEAAEAKLYALAETGTTSRGFSAFSQALEASIESAAAAFDSGGGVSGLATGLIDLDKKLGGLHKSDLIILAGRPGMGKTSLATNIAFNVAKARLEYNRRNPAEDEKPEGGIVAFFSLEMSAEQLATRLLSDAADIEAYRIRTGDIRKEEYQRLVDTSQELHALPLHIDETGGISIDHLMARARRLQRTHGLDLLIIDYLQLITASARKSEGRVQEVSEITQNLKALAKELRVPVIALSQLSRQVESRENKRPQLSDLRESGSIEQDADIVLFVYREHYYAMMSPPDINKNPDAHMEWVAFTGRIQNEAEVIISKQRHGSTGDVKLSFEGKFTRFGNLETRYGQ